MIALVYQKYLVKVLFILLKSDIVRVKVGVKNVG